MRPRLVRSSPFASFLGYSELGVVRVLGVEVLDLVEALYRVRV